MCCILAVGIILANIANGVMFSVDSSNMSGYVSGAMYTVRIHHVRTPYSVRRTVYVYSVNYIVNGVHCTVYTVRCTLSLYTVH